MSWMKKGADAAAAFELDAQEQQMKYEQSKKTWRFWIKEGEEARITFVDGGLTKEGFLDVVSFKEHRLLRNGSWNNFFVCTKETEGVCPICEDGDLPARVALFTVIDHRKVTGKKKAADGSSITYQDVPKLFVAKTDTLKLLTSMGQKRGGLQGCTFDVMRIGNRAPSVGSQFDFIEKQALTLLKTKYFKVEDGKKVTLFKPLDYEKEITYLSADELRQLGFGTILGSHAPSTNYQAATASVEDEESIPFDPDELPE